MNKTSRAPLRALCLLLCLLLLSGMLSVSVFAEGEPSPDGTGICPHHKAHTEACGYRESDPAQACTFVCDQCSAAIQPLNTPDAVCPDCTHQACIGDTHYDHLAEAIDAAVDGDVIELLRNVELTKKTADTGYNYILEFKNPGTYTLLGNGHTITRGSSLSDASILVVDNGVTLNLGKSGEITASTLVLDGQNTECTNPLVRCSGIINMYDGVTLCNSRGNGNGGTAGMEVYNTLNMYGGVFRDNHSQSNSGALCCTRSGTVNITGGKFINNTADSNWGFLTVGAILLGGDYYYSGINATIKNCEFINNSAPGKGYGGAIDIRNAESVIIENCTFNGNSASRYGGAIRVRGADSVKDISIKDCSFVNNSAASLGGAICTSAPIPMEGCTFTGNTSNDAGGAVFSFGPSLEIKNSLFTQNESGEGGGIFAQSCGLSIDDQSAVYRNTASTAGDDVYIYNEEGFSVTLPTAASMNASGKMQNFEAVGWFEDAEGARYDAETHAVELDRLVYTDEPLDAALKVPTRTVYLITFVTNGGAFAENYTVPASYVPGAEVTLPTDADISKDGYRFIGWFENEDLSGTPVEKITSEATGDRIFYAKWELRSTPVTPTVAAYRVAHYQETLDGTYTLVETEFPLYGEIDTTVTASPKNFDHYHVNTDKSVSSGVVTLPVEGEDGPQILSLSLYYDLDTRTVSYDLSSGQGASGQDYSDKSVKYGATLTIQNAPVREGYTFIGWMLDGQIYPPNAALQVTEDSLLTAIWEKIPDDPGTPGNPNPGIPQTGDSAELSLGFTLLLLSVLGIGMTVLCSRKTRPGR